MRRPGKFIVYACPVGELADQLEEYFARSRAAGCQNAAHQYMPHCTLTGFFYDRRERIPAYVRNLSDALEDARPMLPEETVAITGMRLGPELHCLELESPWLKDLVADFASRVADAFARQSLRLKDWLHLSLAYRFELRQRCTLERLAETIVDLKAPVVWELRFYERRADGSWTRHASWPICRCKA